MSTLKKDVQTGRLLIIDASNPPDITAEEFLQYMHEGFVPCARIYDSNGIIFSLLHYGPGPIPGSIFAMSNGWPGVMFESEYSSADSDSGSGSGSDDVVA